MWQLAKLRITPPRLKGPLDSEGERLGPDTGQRSYTAHIH